MALALAAPPARAEVRRLVLVGDSTMAPRTGYGQALCALFRPDLDCVNLARGGRSTKSFREDGSWVPVRALLDQPAAKSTVVLVQFGHNDQPGKPGRSTDLEREFPANLAGYVDEIRAAGATPVIVTPLSRRKYRDGRLDDDLRPWAEAAARVAKEKGVAHADLHGASVRALSAMTPAEADAFAMPPPDFDRTHLGATGAGYFAEIAAREIVAAMPALAAKLATRPQIAERDAGRFALRAVLGDWDPRAEPLAGSDGTPPDFVVDPAGGSAYRTVQDAVDAAVETARREGTGRRLHVRLRPGTHAGPVFVPGMAAPLAIKGEGADPSAVRLVATIAADLAGKEHASRFGSVFARSGEGVKAMAAQLASRDRVGTSGSAVLWVKAAGFQLANLTVENGYNRGASHGERAMQAVALYVDGADRARLERVRLLGLQDTLYLRAADPKRPSRAFVADSLVEGDVDFIFGDATAFFHRTEVRSLGTREFSYALAPATHVLAPHGFVFDECRFTHDGSPLAKAGRYSLARQWFRGARCSPYEPKPATPGYECRPGSADAFDGTRGTISPEPLVAVGKVAILRSRLGSHLDPLRPWADWNAPGTPRYRPVQYHAGRWRSNLETAGLDAARDAGIDPARVPDLPFLAEYRNEPDTP